MPDTTTATWPSLLAGRKARASEVEAKFDWAEANLWPHSAGVTADATYDLGKSSARWKNGWFSGGFNPTSTAAGIAIGKDSANANTCLDLSAMPKAVYLPILTTTQRNALTPQSGFLIYNSTNSRMERYEGGQWLAMNNPIGFAGKAYTATSDAISNTIVKSITGSGRIIALINGAAAAFTIVIDGTTYSITSANTVNRLQLDEGLTTTAFLFEGTGGAFVLPPRPLDISFKNSLVVGMRNISGTSTAYLLYEVS